jgi:hypothetical protein
MRSATYSIFGVQLVAWALLAAIAAMTLGPIGLRPQTQFSPDLERFAAYVVVGTRFELSYPLRTSFIGPDSEPDFIFLSDCKVRWAGGGAGSLFRRSHRPRRPKEY